MTNLNTYDSDKEFPPPSHLRSARTYSGVSFREVSLVLKCSLDIYIHNISSFYPARRRTIRFILIYTHVTSLIYFIKIY